METYESGVSVKYDLERSKIAIELLKYYTKRQFRKQITNEKELFLLSEHLMEQLAEHERNQKQLLEFNARGKK